MRCVEQNIAVVGDETHVLAAVIRALQWGGSPVPRTYARTLQSAAHSHRPKSYET